MLFEIKDKNDINEENKIQNQEIKMNSKYSFFNELQSTVRTDEEFAKFKGYM